MSSGEFGGSVARSGGFEGGESGGGARGMVAVQDFIFLEFG